MQHWVSQHGPRWAHLLSWAGWMPGTRAEHPHGLPSASKCFKMSFWDKSNQKVDSQNDSGDSVSAKWEAAPTFLPRLLSRDIARTKLGHQASSIPLLLETTFAGECAEICGNKDWERGVLWGATPTKQPREGALCVTPTARHGCALSHRRARAAREPNPGCPSASSHCSSGMGSRSLCHPENQKSQQDGHQQPRAACCALPSVAAGWFPEPRPDLEQPEPSTHHFKTKTPTSEVRALSFWVTMETRPLQRAGKHCGFAP